MCHFSRIFRAKSHRLLAIRLETWRNRRREEEDDLTFPDEMDTPPNLSARIRFQRYRGLRSFRTSPWDPFEHLPRDYARIFQFEDFKRTERSVHRRAAQETGTIEVCRLVNLSHLTSEYTTCRLAHESQSV